MARNKNASNAEKNVPSPREQVNAAFDSLIANQPWTEPKRRLAGKSSSTCILRLVNPETESAVELSAIQNYSYVLGVAIAVGEPERRVQWTVRDSTREYAPHAEVTYRDDKPTGAQVQVAYFSGHSDIPVDSIWDLGDMRKAHPSYPDPQINFNQEEGVSQLATLLEYDVPESYVEDLPLKPPQQ